ncbi:short-chain dehydrogenase [Thiocapsa imhoffii]|uniref:Short-chain dehydrogenase n=2 Tax=Thiocapsa imhoffii TaxID=382777 RepID=A0A9X1BAC0_9GAMM|nr:SDR family NAD(P)-dependent oxidoreductase [Thiocapsa imhoffii]MBK1646864.1 short-chain dehydrogenase [Thiocapsa imhoffii]
MGSEFAEKVILITGGGHGIGAAAARCFAEAGARVALADVDRQAGDRLSEELIAHHRQALFVEADVSEGRDCKLAVERVLDTFGCIDILFNNAGITRRANVVETTEKEWDAVIDTNLKSVFLMCKYVVPVMASNGGGVIINTASGWGLVGGKEAVSYCASKGGVVLLTKAMALDHGKDNIRVNCICPGDTRTRMLVEEARQLDLSTDDLIEEGIYRPLGRVGEPGEVAASVMYLASSLASFVTGTALVVDGGGLAGSA